MLCPPVFFNERRNRRVLRHDAFNRPLHGVARPAEVRPQPVGLHLKPVAGQPQTFQKLFRILQICACCFGVS